MSGALGTLKERGFVSQCSDEAGLVKLLDGERTTFYIGFDPTGDSLHVGHLQQLMAMAHLQRAGHQPIALVGGGTARIGDPSGKSEMRKILPVETITANGECFRRQMSRFLDFSEGRALLLDNAEWLAPLNYIEFLRDIGRHFSVNRMLTFEAYKMRLETGLSFIEFNYQLLQSYDYLMLYRRHGCRLQMGGDDQWGNIVAGMDLIRRVDGGEAFALTSPLVTRSDGKKMGKTETGALFLDPKQTSPYDFHQYWVNVPDDDVEQFLLRFTFLPVEEIRGLCAHRDQRINEAKRVLARELTTIVHGVDEARRAEEAARAVFGGGADMSSLPTLAVAESDIAAGLSVIDAIVRSGLCATKSEARRLIAQGGAVLNGKKVISIDATLSREDFSSGAAVLQAGKKKHRRVVLT
ncbi:MAG: tyrosine--tRNA ligase [Spirochaetes bacterium RBG_13_68_11]|nr:MAG: tyrosine--tRNA ligase [Spirochaetes bacterium RBG_13_68_11]